MLHTLPYELLEAVLLEVHRPMTILNLELTCHGAHEYIASMNRFWVRYAREQMAVIEVCPGGDCRGRSGSLRPTWKGW